MSTCRMYGTPSCLTIWRLSAASGSTTSRGATTNWTRDTGSRLPIQEAVEHDVATIAKFQPPDGCLLLAFEDSAAVGTACLRRIAANTCEIKRMWVDPSYRRGGVGRAMLDRLVAAARKAGYQRVRLDSPDFMTAAHGLYRSSGFIKIEPYPESEIPDEYKSHWIFMEKGLT